MLFNLSVFFGLLRNLYSVIIKEYYYFLIAIPN